MDIWKTRQLFKFCMKSALKQAQISLKRDDWELSFVNVLNTSKIKKVCVGGGVVEILLIAVLYDCAWENGLIKMTYLCYNSQIQPCCISFDAL